MYVCMYVCMYACICTYVCMYVCVYTLKSSSSCFAISSINIKLCRNKIADA